MKQFQELSPIVQRTVECLAREIRANVGDEVIQARLVTTPATCSKCRQKFNAPTTGKILNDCPYCDGTLITDEAPPLPKIGDGKDGERLEESDDAYWLRLARAEITSLNQICDCLRRGASINGNREAKMREALQECSTQLWHAIEAKEYVGTNLHYALGYAKAKADEAMQADAGRDKQ